MTPHTFTFHAPAPLLSLNDRTHWAPKARNAGLWRWAALVASRNAKLHDLPPCMVRVTFTVAVNRKRDPSNLLATVKPIVDGGLVDSGAMPDDNSDWVSILEPVIVVDKANAGRVLVECWPMDLTTEAT